MLYVRQYIFFLYYDFGEELLSDKTSPSISTTSPLFDRMELLILEAGLTLRLEGNIFFVIIMALIRKNIINIASIISHKRNPNRIHPKKEFRTINCGNKQPVLLKNINDFPRSELCIFYTIQCWRFNVFLKTTRIAECGTIIYFLPSNSISTPELLIKIQ